MFNEFITVVLTLCRCSISDSCERVILASFSRFSLKTSHCPVAAISFTSSSVTSLPETSSCRIMKCLQRSCLLSRPSLYCSITWTLAGEKKERVKRERGRGYEEWKLLEFFQLQVLFRRLILKPMILSNKRRPAAVFIYLQHKTFHLCFYSALYHTHSQLGQILWVSEIPTLLWRSAFMLLTLKKLLQKKKTLRWVHKYYWAIWVWSSDFNDNHCPGDVFASTLELLHIFFDCVNDRFIYFFFPFIYCLYLSTIANKSSFNVEENKRVLCVWAS